jgi:hypothetical protein
MKLALKRFNMPTNTYKRLNNVNKNLGIRFFINAFDEATPRNSKEIRCCMISNEDPSSQHFRGSFHNSWKSIFPNLIKAANNFILIQDNYKILYRIATSRYLRFKMNVDINPYCQKCGELQTLELLILSLLTTICPKNPLIYYIKFRQRLHRPGT